VCSFVCRACLIVLGSYECVGLFWVCGTLLSVWGSFECVGLFWVCGALLYVGVRLVLRSVVVFVCNDHSWLVETFLCMSTHSVLWMSTHLFLWMCFTRLCVFRALSSVWGSFESLVLGSFECVGLFCMSTHPFQCVSVSTHSFRCVSVSTYLFLCVSTLSNTRNASVIWGIRQ